LCGFGRKNKHTDFKEEKKSVRIRTIQHRVEQQAAARYDKQLDRRRLLMRSDSNNGHPMESASMSCSGYQTFGCGSSYSGDDSDDEGSVDMRNAYKHTLNTLHEVPSISSGLEQDEEDSQPDVTLSLQYSEDQCKLTVTIVNCRNLGIANTKRNTSSP
jgi:hypothetical protein